MLMINRAVLLMACRRVEFPSHYQRTGLTICLPAFLCATYTVLPHHFHARCDLAASFGPAVRRFDPFWFSVEPSDTLAVRGSPALLNCSVNSDTPAKVRWKKDGAFLSLTSDDRRQVLPDGSLLINSVMHSKHNKPDEGVYQCVATIDSLGTIISHTARLNVAGTPRFSGQPEAASVRLGDSQVLSCEVNPDLVAFIRWERDKEPVLLDQRVFTLPSGALVLSNATESDAGLYRCVLENVGPTKTSEEAVLQIQPETWEERGLEFLRQPGPVSKVVGDSVLLPCVVTGYPAAFVRWTHNDEPIDERTRGHGGNFTAEHACTLTNLIRGKEKSTPLCRTDN
ncbi:hypothetical protein AOLI_G00143290 [Acnodon oligacanthus]